MSTEPKIPAPEPVAYYVQRNAPGKRFGDVRIGLWWRESDAAEFADDVHILKRLIDADAAEAYAAAREAVARMRLVEEWNNLPDELREHPGLGGLFAAVQKA